jgi:hypothetical protein
MLRLLLLKRVVLKQQEGSGNIFVRGLATYNSNDPEKNLNKFSLRTLLSISQLTRYTAEVYMAILLR